MCTGFWWGNKREKYLWGIPDVDSMLILRWMKDRDMHRFLIWKLEGKRPLGRPRRR
jgi:hypothetical protein